MKSTPLRPRAASWTAAQLGAVADEHGLHVGDASGSQEPHGLDQVGRAMPGAERASEERRHGPRGTRPRHVAFGRRVKPRRVGAPLDREHAFRRDPLRKNPRARRDDQVGRTHLAVAPASHRLHDQRAIEQRLRRSVVVHDRRVDFQDVSRADGSRGQHALAAEVVVALDHHIGPYLARDAPDASRGQQPQLRAAGRRADVVPVDGPLGPAAVPSCSQGMDVVAQRREPLGHRLHVDGAAQGARHGLVDGAVEDAKGAAGTSREG